MNFEDDVVISVKTFDMLIQDETKSKKNLELESIDKTEHFDLESADFYSGVL